MQTNWRLIEKGDPENDIPGDDVCTIKEFKELCGLDCFIDDDGYGAFSDGERVSDIIVLPTEIVAGIPIPSWATHVCWYNK